MVDLVGFTFVAGFGYLWWSTNVRTSSRPSAFNGTVALPDGRTTKALILPAQVGPFRVVLLLFGSLWLGMVVLALTPATLPRFTWAQPVLILLTVPLGVLVAAMLKWSRRPSPFLAFTPAGLLWNALDALVFIPWHAIRGAEPVMLPTGVFMGIDVTDPSLVMRTGATRRLGGFESTLTGRDILVSASMLALPPDDILALTLRCVTHPDVRARLGSDPALRRTLDLRQGQA